jgi:hypothetical protein
LIDARWTLFPANACARATQTSHVVYDADLTLNEKRAILASWASDACAPEASPHLRCAPGGKQPVPFDDVMELCERWTKRSTQRTARIIGVYCAAAAWNNVRAPLRSRDARSTEVSASAWKSFGGKNMWPDRYELSKFVALTGFIFSFAVILATMAK